MIKATEEHYFTKEELEKWIESVGGIGAEIIKPEDAYWVSNENDLLPMKFCGDSSAVILGIVAYHHTWHVRFYISSQLWTCDMLFPSMRDSKPIKPIVLYPYICKKCLSSARKCDGYIFCSNAKCKTRKFLPYKFNIIHNGTLEHPIEVKCPQCGKIADNLSANPGSLFCNKHGLADYNYIIGKFYRWGHGTHEYLGDHPSWKAAHY